ncbi:MAG: rhomboid family intramembrane serine protease [Paludibacteraceae bacterium]|nr:rhomboid family intramembrane serine protease [Paludibacteraceae bacterium]
MMFDFKSFLKQKNTLQILLYINIGTFLATKFFALVLTLFQKEVSLISSYLMLPASLPLLANRPWTLLTYMFMHANFFHLFFNMLCLLWFGRMFLTYFNSRQLVGLYLLGGIGAGLTYIGAYNFFPYFSGEIGNSMLVGASGALMATILAIAMYVPNYEINLLLLGRIKLKWIACIMILFSMFGITSENAGGEFAHIGGALVGIVYIWFLKKGKDIATPFNKIIDVFVNLFKRKPKIKFEKHKYQPRSDAEYNQQRTENIKDLDKILDKVKASGYSSLTEEEKRRLFDRSQKL